MHFIIATYGAKYLGMLLPCVYSICKADRRNKVIIFYQDVPARIVILLSECDKERIQLKKCQFNLPGSEAQKISQKLLLWGHAAIADKC